MLITQPRSLAVGSAAWLCDFLTAEPLRSLSGVVCHSNDRKECHGLYLVLTWPLLGSSVQFGDSNFPKGTEKLEKVQDRAFEQ